MPLWILQRFINTIELNEDRPTVEELTDSETLREFLIRFADLEQDADVTQNDLERAIEIREALRALLVAKTHGVAPDPGSLDVVNDVIEEAKLAPWLGEDGAPKLSPCTDGVKAALGRIIAIMLDAMETEEWDRFKACARESCRWASFDRSRNRSRTWCSMETCGNVEKVAAFRARHR